MQHVLDYIQVNRDRFEEELFEFLRIPSISAQIEHREDVRRAAAFVADQFESMGFQVETCETPGHPVVLAHYSRSDDAPTALV